MYCVTFPPLSVMARTFSSPRTNVSEIQVTPAAARVLINSRPSPRPTRSSRSETAANPGADPRLITFYLSRLSSTTRRRLLCALIVPRTVSETGHRVNNLKHRVLPGPPRRWQGKNDDPEYLPGRPRLIGTDEQ